MAIRAEGIEVFEQAVLIGGAYHNHRCHPREGGTQYAAAYRFNHCCLWNTGSPPEPVIGRPFGRPGGGDDD